MREGTTREDQFSGAALHLSVPCTSVFPPGHNAARTELYRRKVGPSSKARGVKLQALCACVMWDSQLASGRFFKWGSGLDRDSQSEFDSIARNLIHRLFNPFSDAHNLVRLKRP